MLTFSLVDVISSRIVFLFCSGVDIHANPLAFSLHSSFSFSLSEAHIPLNTGILDCPSAEHNVITIYSHCMKLQGTYTESEIHIIILLEGEGPGM